MTGLAASAASELREIRRHALITMRKPGINFTNAIRTGKILP
jgi:hypothetical protein